MIYHCPVRTGGPPEYIAYMAARATLITMCISSSWGKTIHASVGYMFQISALNDRVTQTECQIGEL